MQRDGAPIFCWSFVTLSIELFRASLLLASHLTTSSLRISHKGLKILPTDRDFNENTTRATNTSTYPLSGPHTKGGHVFDTDTCYKQVGAVLLPWQPDGLPKPIEYWSRSPTQTEHSYNMTKCEWLAVVCTLLLSLPYLKGRQSTTHNDHSSVAWIINLTNAAGSLA